MDQEQQEQTLQRLQNIEEQLSTLSEQVKECNDNHIEVLSMLQQIAQHLSAPNAVNVARLDGAVICRPKKADNKHLATITVELCISTLEEHHIGGETLNGMEVWNLIKDAAYNQAKKASIKYENATFSKLSRKYQVFLVDALIKDVAEKVVNITVFFQNWLPHFAISKSLSGIIDYNARQAYAGESQGSSSEGSPSDQSQDFEEGDFEGDFEGDSEGESSNGSQAQPEQEDSASDNDNNNSLIAEIINARLSPNDNRTK